MERWIHMPSMTRFNVEQSTLFLALSNIATIVVAVWGRWDLSDVMWIYWGQSVVIGYFNRKRILCLKEFSTDGFTINDQPVEPTPATQRLVANFFALHYGIFHLAYFGFLYGERGDITLFSLLGIVVCVVIFGFNHRFSFHHNLEKDINRKPNIGTIMAFPYARILPMHLTILFGDYFAEKTVGTLILFLSLKTVADIIMHLIEHREQP